MAKCKVCGSEMLEADECSTSIIRIEGVEYKRLRFLEPGDRSFNLIAPEKRATARCGDCGCRPGEYHHWGCDLETCPKCGMQLLSCDCKDVVLVAEE